MTSWDDEDDIFDGAEFYNTFSSANPAAQTRNPLPPPPTLASKPNNQLHTSLHNSSLLDLQLSGLPNNPSNSRPSSRPASSQGAPTNSSAADAAAIELGIADEVPAIAGRRVINRAKLDEDRLLDPVLGIPFLQKSGLIPSFLSQAPSPPSSPPPAPAPSFFDAARSRHQQHLPPQLPRVLRGRGHERGDLHRLLQFYQLWAHKLYPVRFDDFIAGALRVGDRPRMKRMRREWLDEEYAALGAAAKRARTDAIDPQDPPAADPAGENTQAAKDSHTHPAQQPAPPKRQLDPDSIFVSGPGAEQTNEDDIDPDDSFEAFFSGNRSTGSTVSTAATSLPPSDNQIAKDTETSPHPSSPPPKNSSPPFVFELDDDDEDPIVVSKKQTLRRINDDDDDEDSVVITRKQTLRRIDDDDNDAQSETEENAKSSPPPAATDSAPFEISDTEPADEFEETALAMAQDMGF